MSDLLSIGASGVRAFNTALATIGENVSNSSSAGYTRRIVTLKQAGVSALDNSFSGVQVDAIGRAGDTYQVALARDAAADAAAASTRQIWLASAETALNDDATGVGQSATAMFTAGASLSANPDGTSGRTAFLQSIDQTASAFRTTAGQLADTANGIAAAATTTVAQANAALDGLAKINGQLRSTQPGSEARAALLDQRDQALSTLATAIGADVTIANDGTATVRAAADGPVLLSGEGRTAAHLAVATAGDGRLAVSVTGSDGTGTAIKPAGGTLSGLSDSAATVADRRTAFDTLAADFASQLNGWNAAGTTKAGAAGGALVSGTTAATLGLATSDPAAIAAAKGGAANGNLLALTDLRGAGGVEARWNAAVTDQGQLVASAKSASSAASARSDAAQSSLAATTGVDLDTEAADLVRYQQAYSGAAKVIQVAKETVQSILDIL